jgi:hypothetical protein
MTSFSQRRGLKPIKDKLQIDSIDQDLKNRLWNLILIYYFPHVTGDFLYLYENQETLCVRLWHSFFKSTIDTIPKIYSDAVKLLRIKFYEFSWNEIYDFIEFIAHNFPHEETNKKFIDKCNSVLEHEMSAYRFVEGRILPLTSKDEVAEIEKAMEITKAPLENVYMHLNAAVDLLAIRKSDDKTIYRNSIKESISAVEAICGVITQKRTLGDALKTIESKSSIKLHPALKDAFEKLYGYTSDAEGIRHAMLKESEVDLEDARFMLVVCSAFINYLIAKSNKAGVKLEIKK